MPYSLISFGVQKNEPNKNFYTFMLDNASEPIIQDKQFAFPVRESER